MARIALSSCFNQACKTLYEIVIEDISERYVTCPVCSQKNPVIDSRHIDNACRECNQALDDHRWTGNEAHCTK